MSDIKIKDKVCPHCMGWLSEHHDPKLKRNGWVKCNTCSFSRKNIKENMHDKKVK